MALDMKAEALSSEPRELLGLFHAIGDPGKLTQKARMILVLGPLMPCLSTSDRRLSVRWRLIVYESPN